MSTINTQEFLNFLNEVDIHRRINASGIKVKEFNQERFDSEINDICILVKKAIIRFDDLHRKIIDGTFKPETRSVLIYSCFKNVIHSGENFLIGIKSHEILYDKNIKDSDNFLLLKPSLALFFKKEIYSDSKKLVEFFINEWVNIRNKISTNVDDITLSLENKTDIEKSICFIFLLEFKLITRRIITNINCDINQSKFN